MAKGKWDSKTHHATGKKEDAKTLNTYIDVIQNKTYLRQLTIIIHSSKLPQASNSTMLKTPQPNRLFTN
jgi:hypothetical protein